VWGDLTLRGEGEEPFCPHALTGALAISPQIYFANERTLLRWLQTSVFLGALATGIGGAATFAHRSAAGAGGGYYPSDAAAEGAVLARVVSLVALAVSIGMSLHAALQFHHRNVLLERKADSGYDNLWGPVTIGVVIMTLLSALLISLIVSMWRAL
jgi:uncharacterized membrane protein YidH (DUF202 family)